MIIIFSDTDDENIAKYSKSRQSYWLHPSTHWTRHPILRQICIFPIRWLGKNHLFETEEMMQKPAPCDAMLLHNYSQIKSSKKTHIYIYNIYMFWEAQPVKCPSIFAGRVTELSGWLFRFSVSSNWSIAPNTKGKIVSVRVPPLLGNLSGGCCYVCSVFLPGNFCKKRPPHENSTILLNHKWQMTFYPLVIWHMESHHV
jgi:hypothetical protein